ncbi:hypothetical protein [Fibrobacter sp. UWR2]|uniref:hypothetical protein n=1 Tax=Fibrobacter sp. UWR2 TaxID=1964352 RepID=UPI001181E68D|nr:hypothetical protein [Fibrobacter sp. UWR2]
MKTLIKHIALFAAILTISSFAAEKVYMAPVGTTNIHSDYGIAAMKLMKTYIEDDGRFILIEGSAQDSVTIEKQETVKNKAVAKGCSKYIIAEFTRLGESVILSFKLYSTSQDAPIWTDRLKAANPDDFDPIIQRVARNIGTREKATSDQDIYNVTENETKLPKRKKVNSYFGIGIGGMVPLSPIVEMTPGVNLFGMYDTQTLLIGLDANFWGMGTDNRYSYADIGISIHYPFGRKFIAPYIGGGLNLSSVDFNTDVTHPYTSSEYDDSVKRNRVTTKDRTDTYTYTSSGVGAYGGAGIMFNRASSIALFFEVKYFVDFYKLEEPKEYVSEDVWNDYTGGYSKKLPNKSSKLFQGFMFDLKFGYGF